MQEIIKFLFVMIIIFDLQDQVNLAPNGKHLVNC